MSFLYLVGQYSNILSRARAITFAGTVSTDFPASKLYDDDPGVAAAFAAAGTDDSITIDANMVTDTDFSSDTTGQPPGGQWVTEAGTPTVETGGNPGNCLRLNAANEASHVDLPVLAGELINLSVDLAGGGTEAIEVRVQNLQTGKYLTSGGAWQTALTAWATKTTTGFATTTTNNVAVEAYSVTRAHACTLRVQAIGLTGTQSKFLDNLAVWPSVDFASIHNHNIDARITVEFRRGSSSAVGSSTLVSAMTMQTPAFYYLHTSTLTDRFFFWKFVGTNTAAIKIGEGIMGKAKVLSRNMIMGWPTKAAFPQSRNESSAGRVTATRYSRDEKRDLAFTFRSRSKAERDELRDEVFKRSFGGEYGTVIVPDTAEDTVIYAKLLEEWGFTREQTSLYESSMTFREQPGWGSAT